jgi:hypothetical protein
VPVSWEIRGSLLILTLSGKCGDALVDAILMGIEDPRFAPEKSLLFDTRLWADHPTSTDFQQRASWLASLRADGIARRCAMVVGAKPHQYGLARMAATYLDFEGMEMEIFKELDEAIEWLDTAAPTRVRSAGG